LPIGVGSDLPALVTGEHVRVVLVNISEVTGVAMTSEMSCGTADVGEVDVLASVSCRWVVGQVQVHRAASA